MGERVELCDNPHNAATVARCAMLASAAMALTTAIRAGADERFVQRDAANLLDQMRYADSLVRRLIPSKAIFAEKQHAAKIKAAAR